MDESREETRRSIFYDAGYASGVEKALGIAQGWLKDHVRGLERLQESVQDIADYKIGYAIGIHIAALQAAQLLTDICHRDLRTLMQEDPASIPEIAREAGVSVEQALKFAAGETENLMAEEGVV